MTAALDSAAVSFDKASEITARTGANERPRCSTTRGKMLGLLYLAPLVIFVAMFTACPAHPDGLDVVSQLVDHRAGEMGRRCQFREGLERSAVLGIASRSSTPSTSPILMILGYLIALLVATNTPLRKFTRAVVFVPVVIGLSVSEPPLVLAVQLPLRPHQQGADGPRHRRQARRVVQARTPTAHFGR